MQELGKIKMTHRAPKQKNVRVMEDERFFNDSQ